MPHVSLRCCIILSPMTESKIGHPCSTRDVTPLGLIGSDWRRPRGGGGRLRAMQKFDVTLPQNASVRHFGIFWKEKKNYFICASIWDKCISDKQPPQIGFRRPEPQRHCVFTTETITEDLITKQENSTTSLPMMQDCQLSFNLINKAAICFSLVLNNTFFCVVLGHFLKGGLNV